MSEQTPEPVPEGGAALTSNDAPESTTGGPPEPEQTEDPAALRREAATYRRRLRDAEAERDGLREQVDRRDRADADRMAEQSMASGADLWTGGIELADVRGEDGRLDPERLTAAVQQVLAERPHWRKAPSVSFDGGARTTPDVAPEHPFGEALKGVGRP